MRSTNASVVPAISSESATVASLPDCTMTPRISSSTVTGLRGSMNIRDPPVRHAFSETGTTCPRSIVFAFSAWKTRYVVISLVSEAGSRRSSPLDEVRIWPDSMSTSVHAAASRLGASGPPGICTSGVSTGAASAGAASALAAAGFGGAASGFGSAEVVVPAAGAGAPGCASVGSGRAQIANASAQDSVNGRMNIIEKRVIILIGMPFRVARALSTRARDITPTCGCATRRGAGASPPKSRVLTRADWHAAAEQVAVAVDIVDAGHRAPVLGVDEARAGIRRLLRVLQRIVGAVQPALLDRADLGADRDHRVDEAIELLLRLALGRLDHQGSRDREAHRRSVESVVDQPFRDVLDLDARCRLQRAQVEDAFVRDQPAGAAVEHRIMRRETLGDVVGREDRALGRIAQPRGAHHRAVPPRTRKDHRGPVGGGADGKDVPHPRQERREMGLARDGADAGAPAAVGNAERLVQVQVRDVRAEPA